MNSTRIGWFTWATQSSQRSVPFHLRNLDSAALPLCILRRPTRGVRHFASPSARLWTPKTSQESLLRWRATHSVTAASASPVARLSTPCRCSSVTCRTGRHNDCCALQFQHNNAVECESIGGRSHIVGGAFKEMMSTMSRQYIFCIFSCVLTSSHIFPTIFQHRNV